MENNFFWEDYLILNTDIINPNKEKGALKHHQTHGKKENRLTKLPDISKFSFIYNFDHQKSILKKYLLKSYGVDIGNMDNLNSECTKDFFYLCNKFKITSEKNKNMLFYISILKMIHRAVHLKQSILTIC